MKPNPSFRPSHRVIQSLKSRADENRTLSEKIADWMTSRLGSMSFLVFNFILFATWIVINLEYVSGIIPFDPFPFGLLTMIVSLEAIMLAIFVLISQNRETKIYNLREETDLQVDVITEQEITKVLELLIKLLKKQGIDVSRDKSLQKMLTYINASDIEDSLEKEIE